MNNACFYTVFNPDGNAPKVAHTDYISACNEAQRLATANPGKKFYVMSSKVLFTANIHVNMLSQTFS